MNDKVIYHLKYMYFNSLVSGQSFLGIDQIGIMTFTLPNPRPAVTLILSPEVGGLYCEQGYQVLI